ncbi:MAG: ChbG/HpnK family deacetylase [Gemmatimonadaceae bacterium]
MATTTSQQPASSGTAIPNKTGSYLRRRLVVNADDLGLSSAVNRGIMKSAERGVVTSVSMMANMAGWDDALALLHATRADISVGLHLNIVAGRPLTYAPSITDPTTGAFYPLAKLAIRVLSGRVKREDVSRECIAQLTKLRTAGILVSHIDSHRHVHALPGIGAAVLETAQLLGVRVIRAPLEPLNINPGNWDATLKKIMLGASWHVCHARHAALTRYASKHASKYSPATSASLAGIANSPEYFNHYVDHFFGISLQGGNHFAARLKKIIDRLPAGTSEIMVHPGFVDAALASVDGYTWQREREVDALTSPALRHQLAHGGIELVNFGSLIA